MKDVKSKPLAAGCASSAQGDPLHPIALRRRETPVDSPGGTPYHPRYAEHALRPVARGLTQRQLAERLGGHGTQIRVDTRGGHPSIGFRDLPREWVSWNKVKFAQAGADIARTSAATPSAASVSDFPILVNLQLVLRQG